MPQKRRLVDFLKKRHISERRACELVRVNRRSYRYRPRTPDETALIARIEELAAENPRYGYRRITVLLRREMGTINHKRVYRLWSQLRLGLPKSRRRKRRRKKPGLISSMTDRPGQVWSYDFLFDYMSRGRRIKLLTVVDEFTRECLAIRVGTSIRARQVMDTLERLFAEHGPPEHIGSDNGPEFLAYTLQDWLYDRKVTTLHIQPGKPWQNGLVESFHSRLRDECLNLEYFSSVREAQVICEKWRRQYNYFRPHSSLGDRSPAEFKAAWKEQAA